jgi:hypothetical protein
MIMTALMILAKGMLKIEMFVLMLKGAGNVTTEPVITVTEVSHTDHHLSHRDDNSSRGYGDIDLGMLLEMMVLVLPH